MRLKQLAPAVLAAAASNRARIGRLRQCLGAIPDLPDFAAERPSLVDLLTLTKFVSSWRRANRELSLLLNLQPVPESWWPRLPSQLDAGREEGTFYFEDRASPDLAKTRGEIAEVDRRLRQLRSSTVRKLARDFGLRFGWREFLVLSSARAGQIPEGRVLIEPHDSAHVLARPLYPAGYRKLGESRAELVEQERGIEARLRGRLWSAARGCREELRAAARASASLATALAKAATESAAAGEERQ